MINDRFLNRDTQEVKYLAFQTRIYTPQSLVERREVSVFLRAKSDNKCERGFQFIKWLLLPTLRTNRSRNCFNHDLNENSNCI